MACVRQPQSQCFLYMTLISLLLQNVLATSSTTLKMSLPNCPDKCGDITIPYPFGIGPNCCRDDEFLVTCNNKTNPPKALVGSESSTIELIDINISSGQARVYKYIAFRCYSQMDQIYRSYNESVINLTGTPYLFSNKHNKFTAIGCDTFVGIVDMPYFSGCQSTCLNGTISDGESCNGSGCCQAPIPPGLDYYEVMWVGDNNSAWLTNPCLYAVLVEEDWYKFQKKDLTEYFLQRNPNGVPVVLDWAIRKNGTCLQDGVEESSKPACLSKNSTCYNTTNGDGYLCNCSKGYEGNPYLPDGCIDIDECEFPDKYPCHGSCANVVGDYQCHCPKGLIGDAKISNCTKHEEFPWLARVVISSVLSVAIFLGLCFLIVTRLQHKKHTKEKEEYQRYYDMMDNYLRVFSKKQIEIATNNFDENRVLGAGGHGKVYKGYLEENQPVAIKRSKEVEEDQRAEFVNEILLLSKINHKNIVRLLGCCIEVDIPMLVYEFISNGTLDDLLHGKGKNRPIPLHTRLNIALESSDALDYLHSTVSRSILHGDVKSANILLEENYHVKVSDFGASNLVPTDDTQVVKVVQGTRGYVDPEYVATAILTKKSDVYSFGVVLLELITRKCAIFTDDKHERKHLASCFISSVSKNKLHELLDKDIVSTNEKVTMILQEVSELAVWCLSVRGEDRPTMSQVKEKLQNLVKLYNSVLGPEAVEEEKQSLLSAPTSYFTSDSSAFHSTTGSSVLEIEPRVPR